MYSRYIVRQDFIGVQYNLFKNIWDTIKIWEKKITKWKDSHAVDKQLLAMANRKTRSFQSYE